MQRIKTVPNDTRLLVVDSEADRWYKEKNYEINGSQENILYGTSQKNETVDNDVDEKEKTADNSPSVNGNSEESPVPTTNGHDETSKSEDDEQSIASASSQSETSTQPQVRIPLHIFPNHGI